MPNYHRRHDEHHRRHPRAWITNLRSEQGLNVSLRFVVGTTFREGERFTEKAIVESVLIESEATSLTGKTITLILINHYDSINEKGQESHCEKMWSTDVQPDEDYACFYRIENSIFSVRGNTGTEIFQCYPELVVCLKNTETSDEDWQVDPVNGTHNFRFSWAWHWPEIDVSDISDV